MQPILELNTPSGYGIELPARASAVAPFPQSQIYPQASQQFNMLVALKTEICVLRRQAQQNADTKAYQRQIIQGLRDNVIKSIFPCDYHPAPPLPAYNLCAGPFSSTHIAASGAALINQPSPQPAQQIDMLVAANNERNKLRRQLQLDAVLIPKLKRYIWALEATAMKSLSSYDYHPEPSLAANNPYTGPFNNIHTPDYGATLAYQKSGSYPTPPPEPMANLASQSRPAEQFHAQLPTPAPSPDNSFPYSNDISFIAPLGPPYLSPPSSSPHRKLSSRPIAITHPTTPTPTRPKPTAAKSSRHSPYPSPNPANSANPPPSNLAHSPSPPQSPAASSPTMLLPSRAHASHPSSRASATSKTSPR